MIFISFDALHVPQLLHLHFPYNHINDQAAKCNGNDIRFHLRCIVLLLVEKMETQTSNTHLAHIWMVWLFMCLSFMKDERVTRVECILYWFFLSNGQTTLKKNFNIDYNIFSLHIFAVFSPNSFVGNYCV